jgi:hypothetical protein
MSGSTIPLFSRREFDFSEVRGDRCVDVLLVKAVDVSQYTRGTLEVRIHDRDISGSGARIWILAYTTAPTAEDPSVDFIDDSSPVASIVVDDSDDRTPPVLATAELSSGFGGMLAIVVRGEQARAPVDALAAELSAFLTIKS